MKPVTPVKPQRTPFPSALTQHQFCLPGEDPKGFDQLCAQLLAEFSPKSFAETQLVSRLALMTWRLVRLYRIEANLYVLALMEAGRNILPNAPTEVVIAQLHGYLAEHPKALLLTHKQQQQLEKAWDQALQQLLKLQDRRLTQRSRPAASSLTSRDHNRRVRLWYRSNRLQAPPRSSDADKTSPIGTRTEN